MDEKLRTLYDLCDTVSRELEDCTEKVRKAGGKLSPGDVDYLDKLTHMLKSVKTTIAMMEAEDDEGGYSNMYPRHYSYADGMRNGHSRAGRMNARRDSMGRYSRTGYSYAEDVEALKGEMRDIAQHLPDEHRRKIERALDDLR